MAGAGLGAAALGAARAAGAALAAGAAAFFAAGCATAPLKGTSIIDRASRVPVKPAFRRDIAFNSHAATKGNAPTVDWFLGWSHRGAAVC
jgi:hypothetical protein